MKKYIFTLAALIITTLYSFGQIDFKLNDKELENELNTLNTKAEQDLNQFKVDMSTQFKMAGEKVDEYLKILKPGEIILAGRIGEISKQPIGQVVNSYQSNKEKGWGVVAKEMGIKPGSAEFHALKGKTKKGEGNSQASGKSNHGNSNKSKKK